MSVTGLCLSIACDSDSDFAMLSEDLKRYLFIEKILSLSPSTLTRTGFKLFEHYLVRVNDKAGHLRVDPEYGGVPLSKTEIVAANVVVQAYNELQGVTMLWEITNQNPDEIVGRRAMALLNALHQNLSSKLK